MCSPARHPAATAQQQPKAFLDSLSSAWELSEQSFAFPFQDGRPRVFHIDGLSEQQKGIAMVTASLELLGKTVGPMDPNSKADLCIGQPQPKRSQYEKEKKLLFPPHKF